MVTEGAPRALLPGGPDVVGDVSDRDVRHAFNMQAFRGDGNGLLMRDSGGWGMRLPMSKRSPTGRMASNLSLGPGEEWSVPGSCAVLIGTHEWSKTIVRPPAWTEDERGAFDWAPPDDDVFVFITELMRSAGTYLYGRRMYETLAVWETDATLANQSDLMADYASAWKAADKVAYSSTLAAPLTASTRLERHFDPGAVHELKATARRDLLVGGPNLAAQALVAGLVDELALFVWPVVLGGRTPALPTDIRVDLALIDEHRFSSGVVHLRYRVR